MNIPYSTQSIELTDQQIIWIAVVLSVIIILIGLAFTPLKIKLRKKRADILNQCLTAENKKLIKDEEDLRLIELYAERANKYAKSWYFNNTPTHWYRNSKVNKIIKKYKLEIDKK